MLTFPFFFFLLFLFFAFLPFSFQLFFLAPHSSFSLVSGDLCSSYIDFFFSSSPPPPPRILIVSFPSIYTLIFLFHLPFCPGTPLILFFPLPFLFSRSPLLRVFPSFLLFHVSLSLHSHSNHIFLSPPLSSFFIPLSFLGSLLLPL